MSDKTFVTFEQNKPVKQVYSLNHCKFCGRRAGKFMDQHTYETTGIFLYADARGFKVCNLCKDNGDFIEKRKLTKIERKQLTKLKHAMKNLGNIPHITLNSRGEVIK